MIGDSSAVFKIGTLVVIKEDGVAPLEWQLGRIISTYPGFDGQVRVVSVKTQKGIFKREIRKICILPMD